MMKNKNLVLLLAATLLLSGCGNNTSSDSSSTGSNTSSSDTSSGESTTSSSETKKVSGSWTDEQQELLKTFCGEVLPYPADGYLNGDVAVEEVSYFDWDAWPDINYLKISDSSSSSFSLKNYFYDLVDAGWTVRTGYNGNNINSTNKDGVVVDYCELTKLSSDGSTGYRIFYYYVPAVEADEESGTEAVPGHHVVECTNTMVTKETDYSSWDWNEYYMTETLTFTLPFMKLGNGFSVNQLDANTLTISDNYVEDLTQDYKKILEANDFMLSVTDSKKTDSYVLVKKVDDYTTVAAALKYYNGNQFVFTYNAKYQESTGWPTSAVKEFEDETDVSVPSFTSDDGKYYFHKKGDSLDIYGYVEDNYSVESSYGKELAEKHFQYNGYDWGTGLTTYLSWSETLQLGTYTATNIANEKAVLGLKVSLHETDYVLTSSWPSTVISTLATKYGVEVSAPKVDNLDTTLPIKYQTSEYEDWNEFEVRMVIYDPEVDDGDNGYNSYFKKLKGLGWHKESDVWGNDVFEDPTGALKISLSWANNIFNVAIGTGSGVAHEPSLSFDEKAVNVEVGKTYTPSVSSDMLVSELTYTISGNDKVTLDEDKDGNVAVVVASDAVVGSTATVEVSGKDINGNTLSSTLTVTVVDKMPYTLTSAVDKFAELYSDLTGQAVSRYGDNPFVDTGSSKTSAFYEENTSSFLPEGFTLVGDWADGTINNSYDSYNSGLSCRYVDATCEDGITLRFYSYYDNYYCGYNLCAYAFQTPTALD